MKLSDSLADPASQIVSCLFDFLRRRRGWNPQTLQQRTTDRLKSLLQLFRSEPELANLDIARDHCHPISLPS